MSRANYSSCCYRFAFIGLSLFFLTGCLRRAQSSVTVVPPRTSFSSTASSSLLRALQAELANATVAPGVLRTAITTQQDGVNQFDDEYMIIVKLGVDVTYSFNDGRPDLTHHFVHAHTTEQPHFLGQRGQARLLATRECCEQLAKNIVAYLEKQ